MEVAVISKEMDLARQVQVALIPTSAPKIVGIESEGWALTASVTGGDCYDLWQLKDGRLAILLADASGHGLAPAMIVSQVRTLARTLCEFETHPHGLLARINRRLADDLETTRFVTAFFGFLSPDGTLDWAKRRSRPHVLAPTNSGEMLALDSTGTPLGIMPDCFLEDPQPPLKLADKGSLIVFSDGIFEAHAPDGKMFGVERVKEILEKTNGQPCEPILSAAPHRRPAMATKTRTRRRSNHRRRPPRRHQLSLMKGWSTGIEPATPRTTIAILDVPKSTKTPEFPAFSHLKGYLQGFAQFRIYSRKNEGSSAPKRKIPFTILMVLVTTQR